MLKWLVKIVSYIYKTVIKPILKWITETIRTLKTWVEKVIRYITERIQDGWNYITRTIVEKVKEFIEKFEVVGSWVTRTITVPDIEWVEIPVPPVVSNLLSANTLKIIGGIAGTALMAGAAITSCTSAVTPTPTEDPRVLTLACGQTTQIAMNATQTAQAAWQTPSLNPVPTATATVIPGFEWLLPVGSPGDLSTQFTDLLMLNAWINEYNSPENEITWQNMYNQYIFDAANNSSIPPRLLKGILMRESKMALSPENSAAFGIGQFTIDGLEQAFTKNPNSDIYIETAYLYAKLNGNILNGDLPKYIPNNSETSNDQLVYSNYYEYFNKALTKEQQELLQNYSQYQLDGECTYWDTLAGKCSDENTPNYDEGKSSIDLVAQTIKVNREDIINIIGQTDWNNLPTTEQWKLVSASYNGGVTCATESFSDAKKVYGQVSSWAQVKSFTAGNCIAADDTSKYPDIVVCYASGSGEKPCD